MNRAPCGHQGCGTPCRFSDTDPAVIAARMADARDASQFRLFAYAAPKLSVRGKHSLYSGIAYHDQAL